MKICHFADIHWRGLSRHAEYRRAFERTFQDIKDNVKPDLIVICGDIVHSKTQGISPELIDNVTWWLNAMADICDVHVILGNHDGNLMNPHRQDAISPIVAAINRKEIYLYKKSGTYKTKHSTTDAFLSFNVFSLFDEEGYKDVRPSKGDINIALYHGSVRGAMTDAEWALESDVDIEFFKGYDFVMLGDIHKKQFLAHRNGKPWIAYPGSCIQQDYGEQTGKGYLLWDIRSTDDFDVEFKEIAHDRQFYTIEWMGSTKETVKCAKSLPAGSRIRVRSDMPIQQVEANHLVSELLSNASEVVFKNDYVPDSNVITTEDETLHKHDIRNIDVFMKIFKKYIGESMFSDNEWSKITDLTRSYMSRAILDEGTARNVRWHLDELQFDNVFGYGIGNKVNFQKLSGITGVLGPNRVGKSSIIGSLLYTLFNGTDRGSIKNLHVINTRKDYCRTKLTFTVNSVPYRVERQSVRHETRGVQHAVTSMNLFELDAKGNVIKEMNGEQRTDTEKVLRSLVGTAEDIMLTGIATQGNMNEFINAGSTYRDKVMARLLDLVIFDKMYQYIKNDSSDLKAQVKNAPDRDWDTVIAANEACISSLNSDILSIENELKNDRLRLDNLRLQLAVKFPSGIITHHDVELCEKRLDDAMLKHDQAAAELERTQKTFERLSVELDDTIMLVNKIPIEDLQNQVKSINSLKDATAKLRQSYEKEKQVYTGQQKSVKRLQDVPCGDMFPNCMYIKDSHADKLKIESQKTLIDNLWLQISKADEALAAFKLSDIEAKLNEHAVLLKKESKQRLDLLKVQQSTTHLKRDIEQWDTKIKEAGIELADMRSRVIVDDSIDEIKNSMRPVEERIAQLDSKRVSIATKRGHLESDNKKLHDEKQRFAAAKAKWKMYDALLRATSKDGIPAQIIQSQLPVINAEIAKILHGVVDYTLKLEKDAETNSTEIYIDYGDSKRLIELGSGMEKMISSLAIRVALQNASSLPRPDFLMLDEGFGTLDEMNVEACNRLLVSLKRWFKNIIIITHIDGMKDVTDNIIDISRRGKDSYVFLE